MRPWPRAAALLVVPLVLAGCHGGRKERPVAERAGPPGVVRIALTSLTWPLDPALVEGRDETTLARAIFGLPLRVDPATGALRPGLCTTWRPAEGFRTWRLRCREAPRIAAQLRRVAALPYAPERWLFARASSISAPSARSLVVRLRFPWRRFPYALTAAAAAPPGVPGAFRVVSGSSERVVAERPGLRLVFTRLGPYAATRAFRRGLVDEAPVAPGDVRAARADPALQGELRVRRLLGLDLVGFRLDGGPFSSLLNTRRAYSGTAARGDYQALVPELEAPAAYGLLPFGAEAPSPAATRQARALVALLPPVRLRIAVERDPVLLSALDILWAGWRELGLAPAVTPVRDFRRRLVDGRLDAWFRRVVAPYPKLEALPASLILPRDGSSPWGDGFTRARARLLRALAGADERPALQRTDEQVRAEAALVPVAWAIDARLVSRRLEGWSEDALGVVDYTRVRAPSR